jgi:hypothetical protein
MMIISKDIIVMNRTARKLTREEEDLLDSKTIFKYNMISKIKKDIFIVVELINPKNVSFLYNKGREQNDEYRFIKANMNIDGTASFAAGEVYFSSIMDNIITQAYYNPSLLAVLKKLILGEDQTTYKKAPLSKYKNINSSNLYIVDLIDERKYETDDQTGTRHNEHDGLMGKKVQTFKDVFLSYLKQKIVVLGVYRAIDGVRGSGGTINTYMRTTINSNFYYVVTSPPPEFELNPKDKLFVLSQTYPDEDHIDNKKGVVSKLGSNDIMKQLEMFQFGKTNKKEDKKENQKLLDQEGEKKIKEVKNSLAELIDNLKSLKTCISNSKEKVDRELPYYIKKKIGSLNDVHKFE